MNLFISYSRQNEDFAARLTEDLQNMGAETWRDREDIPAGTNWDNVIEQGIRQCTHFLLIATPHSVNSENVKDELGLAADLKKVIIPILLQDCELPMRARRVQWVDFRHHYDEALLKLAAELGLEKPVPHHVYKPFLDRLFAQAETLMAELADLNGGCFTNQQFLKTLARRNPADYIDLLYSTKTYYLESGKDPLPIFNDVHRQIGRRLSRVAQQAGYQQTKLGRTETDIWDNATNEVRYCWESG